MQVELNPVLVPLYCLLVNANHVLSTRQQQISSRGSSSIPASHYHVHLFYKIQMKLFQSKVTARTHRAILKEIDVELVLTFYQKVFVIEIQPNTVSSSKTVGEHNLHLLLL